MPLCRRFPFKGAEPDLFAADAGRIRLDRVELLDELRFAQSRDLGLVVEAREDLLRLRLDLPADTLKLRAKSPEARMVLEQHGRLVGNLRLDVRLGLLQPLDDLRTDDVRQRVRRATRLQCGADVLGPCLGIGAFAPDTGKLGRDVVQLLGRETAALGGLEKAGLGPVVRDLALGLADPFRQGGDLGLQPLRRFRLGVQLGTALDGQVDFRHLVGDGCRKLRIMGGEFDRDDARVLDRIDPELLPEFADHPFLGRDRQRVLGQAEQHEGAGKQRMSVRVELGDLVQLEVTGDLLDQVARLEDLRLAGNVEGVEDGVVGGGGRLGGIQVGRAGFDQDPRLSPEARRHHGRHRKRKSRRERGRTQQTAPVPPDGGEKPPQVDIRILTVAHYARHSQAPTSPTARW